MSIAGDAPEPDFFFEGGPQAFRTFEIEPRDKKDRGGYKIETWFQADWRQGQFYTVSKRGRRDAHAVRILQPNANGMMWKKISEGDYLFEAAGDLEAMKEKMQERAEGAEGAEGAGQQKQK